MDDHLTDDRLDPEQDDAVRRLLADARHDEPIPGDLAARLNRVLADLATETVPEPRVVDLAIQTRRRRARNLLVAAAAVGVIGVGLGQLDLGSRSDGDDAETSFAQDAESPLAAAEPAEESAAELAEELAGESAAEAGGRTLDRTSVEVSRKPLSVGEDDFAALAAKQATLAPAATTLDQSARGSWFTCRRAPFGAGRLVAVRYQGAPAVLAVRPRTGDSVVVELLQCGTATVLRSATVPLP